MSRGFFSASVAAARAAERQARAEQRARERHKRTVLRAEQDAARKATRLFHENQVAEADALTKEAQDRFRSLETILERTLNQHPAIVLTTLKRRLPHKPSPCGRPELDTFLPSKPRLINRLFVRTRTHYETSLREAHDRFVQAMADFNAAELTREREFQAATAEVQKYNEGIDQWITALKNSDSHAVHEYMSMVLERLQIIEDFESKANVGLLPASSHLVADYFLPDVSIIPDHASFVYNRTRQTINAKAISAKERKSKYADVLAQSALAILSTVFRADAGNAIQCITLNCMIDTTDRSTGRDVRVCVLSVRADRDTFQALNLNRVDAIECLRNLKASVSRSPDELQPVKPILELNMTDPRFIETSDVLSTLDQRPNLMDLTPGEFEALITNLFAKMGLETRLTQPSRDGGVDCVAYDQRPILGGKVVIQAKRYKNTVGVGSVRNLFGTVQNEGASKGILVTTSGYGKAAFEFAAGKPLELLDGSNLLYLLEERAGIKAKIVMPDNLPEWNSDR